MPLKRGKKARIAVDLVSLPRNHFHCLVPKDVQELGFGFKNIDGNHWPQIVTVEDDCAVAKSEPRVVVGCKVVSINGVTAGATYEQALPLMAKRPLQLVFCDAMDQNEQDGEQHVQPAAPAAATMRLDSGKTVGRVQSGQDCSDDFFGFGPEAQQTTNPAAGKDTSKNRFAAAETFDVEEAPSHRRPKKGDAKAGQEWQGVDEHADPSLYRWGDEDDDIGGNLDTVREKHYRLNLGDETTGGGVSGVNMFKRRQRQRRRLMLGVVTCLTLLAAFWTSLLIAGHNSHLGEKGCTSSYCEEEAGSTWS